VHHKPIFHLNYLDKPKPKKTVTSTLNLIKFNVNQCKGNNITSCDLNKNDMLNFLYSAFQQSFTNIKLKNTTTGEIEKNIKELKSKS